MGIAGLIIFQILTFPASAFVLLPLTGMIVDPRKSDGQELLQRLERIRSTINRYYRERLFTAKYIEKRLKEDFGIKVSYSSIYSWLSRFEAAGKIRSFEFKRGASASKNFKVIEKRWFSRKTSPFKLRKLSSVVKNGNNGHDFTKEELAQIKEALEAFEQFNGDENYAAIELKGLAQFKVFIRNMFPNPKFNESTLYCGYS